MNASAGHLKRCGEPHLARGPLYAHPCYKFKVKILLVLLK